MSTIASHVFNEFIIFQLIVTVLILEVILNLCPEIFTPPIGLYLIILYLFYILESILIYDEITTITILNINEFTSTHGRFRLNQSFLKLYSDIWCIPVFYIIQYFNFEIVDSYSDIQSDLGYLFLSWSLGVLMFLPYLDRNIYFESKNVYSNCFATLFGMYSFRWACKHFEVDSLIGKYY